MTDEFELVRNHFIAALENEGLEAQLHYAAEQCGDSPELLAKLEEMIRAHHQTEGFLASEAEGTPTTLEITEKTGSRIGPYKLLQQIGEGGMGVVYMAEQIEPVERRVALKIIKPGMDSRQVIARFEAERQALAMMDHPNIAKVLDAGTTTSGQPFFAMELVNGLPITQFCDQHHFNAQERLELFVQVCHAVQHAHQKGIIHRDLKPSNIMVAMYDDRPVPKVIDFGVAKAVSQRLTDKTMFTTLGQIVGTIDYMSPEQAQRNQLNVDTRSDIYSLGVVLYELLAGETPFDRQRLRSAAFEELMRIIREEEPPRPSIKLGSSESLPSIAVNRRIEPQKLSALVRGDLDWIVMKALEKERARRYETANGLARDLQRFLEDQPVEACPPSAAYRFRKFARRNRIALATGILVAASLVMGVAGSTWQAIRATRAERLAEQRLVAETNARTQADLARAAESKQRELAEAEQAIAIEQRAIAETERAKAVKQRAIAEANYQKARQAVDEYFTQISENQLLDVPGLQSLRKDLLDGALRFYQNSADERSDDPAVLADLALTYLRVAVIYNTLDRNDDGIATLGKAMAVIDRLQKEFPDAREELRSLAGFWKGFRPTTMTTKLPKNPLAASRTLTRLNKTWEALAQQFPDEAGFRGDLAALGYLTGNLLASALRFDEGSSHLIPAKEILQRLVREVPSNPEYRADLARIHELLSHCLTANGRMGEAEAEGLAALTLRDTLVEEFPASPAYRSDLCNSLDRMVRIVKARDSEAADRYARRQIELSESLMRDYPNVPLYRAALIKAQAEWLKARIATARKAEIDEALPVTDEWIAESSPDALVRDSVAYSLRQVAIALPIGYQAKETALHQRSLERFQMLADEFPDNAGYREEVGHASRHLGWSLQRAGDVEGARQSFQKSADIFEKLSQADIDQRDGFYREMIARMWRARGNEAEAINVLQSLVRDYPNVPRHRTLLIKAQTEWLKARIATTKKAEIDQALPVTDEWVAESSPDASVRNSVASALRQVAIALPIGYQTKETALYQQSLERFQTLADEYPDNANYREEVGHAGRYLGWSLQRAGDPEGARQSFQKSADAFEQLSQADIDQRGGVYFDWLADTRRHIARMWRAQGNESEAQENEAQAINVLQSLVRDYPNVPLHRATLIKAQAEWLKAIIATAKKAEIDQALLVTDEWIAESSPDASVRGSVARSLREVAFALPKAYQAEETALFQRSFERFQTLADEYPDIADYRVEVAQFGRHLGWSLQRAGDSEGARQSFQRSADAFEQLSQADINQRDGFYREMLANTIYQIGRVSRQQENEAEAIEAFKRSLGILEELAEQFPDKIEKRNNVAGVLLQLGQVLKSQGDAAEAQQVLERCAAVRQDLVAQRPENIDYRNTLAETLLALERYQAASETLQAILELEPGNVVVPYWIAVLRLHLDDREGYRQMCERMRQQFGDAGDPRAAYWLAWTCGLAPDALDDLSTPLTRAQQLVDAQPNDPANLTTLGLIFYRSGRYDEADERLKQSIKAFEDNPNTTLTVIYPQLLLAMTHRQLGHSDEAERYMREVRTQIEKEPIATMPWNRRLTFELWQREAETLVPGTTADQTADAAGEPSTAP